MAFELAGDVKSPKEKFVVQTPKATRKPRPRMTKLSDPEDLFIKMMSYGHTGTGKTRAIGELLEAGLKICSIGTDVGGEGLLSVRTYLKDRNLSHLADNLYHVELPTYEDVEVFCKSPEEIFPDIYDVGISLLNWDGFTGFQQFQLSDYISAMEPLRGSSSGKEAWEARQSGLWLEQTDWGAVKMGTLYNLSRFLYLHNIKTGQKWHKYITCLESGSPKEDKLTKQLQKTPLIQGAAASMLGPAFDVIIQMHAKDQGEGKAPKYEYRMVGSSGLQAKSRGLKFNPTEEASMLKVWQSICTQLGLNSQTTTTKG